MPEAELTDSGFWDRYWDEVELPVEIRREHATSSMAGILDVFDRHLPPDRGIAALEVGGAPGQYLAYLHRRFGYECSILDYSEVGCQKARRNFELLGIPLAVHHGDLFAPPPELPRFDVVYSLGLIEHFDDLDAVVARHADLVKPGGTLLLGCPNFQGLTHAFMRRLSPGMLALHNLRTMDVSTWDSFERRLGLSTVFRGYVGGFEPGLLVAREPVHGLDSMLNGVARGLTAALQHGPRALRRVNGRRLSGYAIGVYRLPPERRSTASSTSSASSAASRG